MSGQQQEVIIALKKLLKAKGIVYQDLAHELGLSLASIKRLFSQEDLTLSRLDQICTFAGMQMSDVFKLVESSKQENSRELTDEQENRLTQHPQRLAYLELLLSGMKPKQIEKEFKLSEAQTHKILSDLDKWELIDWLPGNKIRLKISEMIKLKRQGPLRKLLQEKGVKSFLEADFSGDLQYQEFMTMKVSESTLRKLSTQFKALLLEAAKDGVVEAEVGLPVKSVGAFVAIRPWRIVDVFGL